MLDGEWWPLVVSWSNHGRAWGVDSSRSEWGGASLTLALSQGERECWMGVVGRSW